MPDEPAEGLSPAAKRLCSEIQLFDLCDLDSCRFKSSRFCTNEELLSKFESIKEEDDRNTLLYEEEESDDGSDSDSDFDDSDDSFDDDENL
jgi:hypothetical protein